MMVGGHRWLWRVVSIVLICLPSLLLASRSAPEMSSLGPSRRRSPPPPLPPPAPPLPWQPEWTAPAPSLSKPLAGYAMAPSATHSLVYGGAVGSAYNHAAMIDVFNGTMLICWKNGVESEDKRGQRILFSTSDDGEAWSNATVLFPDMSTSEQSAAMFVGPLLQIRGRWYVGASPGVPTSAAEGAQFCLWPDPLDLPSDEGGKRNCGPPGWPQAEGTLLMRQVIPSGGAAVLLGDVFWFGDAIPRQWREASKALGFKTKAQMDPVTVSDMATLSPQLKAPLPCGPRKCEACLGGCQVWDAIPKSSQPFIGNERAHYDIPGKDADMILYRSGAIGFLWASYRENRSSLPGQGPGELQRAWSPPVVTNIPNDESNLNTGTLPDGSVYLLNNPLFRPKPALASTSQDVLRTETLRLRDPLTVATSTDGKHFSRALAVMTCTNLSASSTCSQRLDGTGKNPGPSYPQGIALSATDVSGYRLRPGLYVVATNNKEDVWLAHVALEDLTHSS